MNHAVNSTAGRQLHEDVAEGREALRRELLRRLTDSAPALDGEAALRRFAAIMPSASPTNEASFSSAACKMRRHKTVRCRK